VAPCTDEAPPDSFQPVVQWEWFGEDGYTESVVTPLVANFTDDDRSGDVDLCDTPDVLVVAAGQSTMPPARMFLLDGASGTRHFVFDGGVDRDVTPAIGDLDGDGLVEVVTARPGFDGVNYVNPPVVAFEHDGTVKWTSAATISSSYLWTATAAIADVDADGDPEIAISNLLLDADGTLLQTFPTAEIVGDGYAVAAPLPVDLDGDGDLEILYGRAAYHHDGSSYFLANALASSGFPQVANLDGDPEPEIVVTTRDGITTMEADGTIAVLNARPTGVTAEHLNWLRPAAIHDIEADGGPELLLSSKEQYSAYDPSTSLVWSAAVLDGSGAAAGTAFDFLGDGSAEAIYGDETQMMVFDGVDGTILMQTPRSSWTSIEFPTVADVDNDGSAEVLVVNVSMAATVQAIADSGDRWVPARRIWNQHAYHVTNVREDGTIPQQQTPNWAELNTFRTQAQIAADGAACVPPQG
jgi:hypothetical protein